MIYTEKKRMQKHIDPISQQPYGHFELLHLAKPETVRVLIHGNLWIPDDFNEFGEPIFGEDLLLRYEELEKKKQTLFSESSSTLKAFITYEEADFSVPREQYDSSDGFFQAIKSLPAFTTLIRQRRIWRKVAKDDDTLREFIVFGKYFFDRFGGVSQIEQEACTCYAYPVCPKEFFDYHAGPYSLLPSCILPTPESICPLCKKGFTMHDLSHTKLKMVSGKIVHEVCSFN